MAIYNGLVDSPHPDADLFLDYQYRFLKIINPEVFFCEMTPPHTKSASHDKVVRQLQELGYHVYVTDGLPSYLCGDYTHRDRWFAIAFRNDGPSYDIFSYCTEEIRPVSLVLDPISELDRNLTVDEPCPCRIRGRDTFSWGDEYHIDPRGRVSISAG
jgi:site-specific DNA-cytosine methylase